MDELERIEKLVELEIIKRKYEKLLDMVLEDIQMYDWSDKVHVDEDAKKIMSFLELLEQERFEARKKQLLIAKQEKEKQKQKEKDE